MLTITIPAVEGYDEASQSFVVVREELQFRFEHSLLSITEWEAKYKKPFLVNDNKTQAEVIDYYLMMCLDDDFNIQYLDQNVADQLSAYLGDSQTATRITPRENESKTGQKRIMTSEVIYAYMANGSIWKECESWPINKLMTLISVIGEINNPPEPMSQEEIIKQNRELNEKRKAMYNTKG